MKHVTDQEYRDILVRAEIASFRDWALLYMTGHLGLRVGEAVKISAADIVFNGEGGTAQVRTEKRGGEVFPVYFGQVIAFQIRRILDAVPQGKRTGPIFPMTIRTAQRIWRKHAPAGSKGIHSLRHWFGIYTYGSSRDILLTKQQLRHADVSSTLVYARVVDSAAAVRDMEGIA